MKYFAFLKNTATFLLLSATSFGNTYTVTSTANGTTSDNVSLRWAITQANSNPGNDIINFNLGSSGGPFTILLTAALPTISDATGFVTIDGWTNTGNNGTANSVAVFNATAGTPMNPTYKIILSNSSGTVQTGLVISSNSNIIKGLVLQNFGGGTFNAGDIAITISGNSNQVLGCYIGMDYTGTTKAANTDNGIKITGANNIIGDGTAAGANLISGINGNASPNGYGILITGASATGNTVKGNMVGLQKDGASIANNTAWVCGMRVETSANSNNIGGSAAGDGNVISAHFSVGISLSGVLSTNILGNRIGPRADGVTYVTSHNQSYGIFIYNSSTSVIGGSAAGARNVISGNVAYGIYISSGGSSTGNLIKGNYIGIAADGINKIASSNQGVGVFIESSANTGNQIGGSAAGEGNVISANGSAIKLDGTSCSCGSSGTIVKGNILGLQSNGSSAVGSANQLNGVVMWDAQNNTIGGTGANERNFIAGNTQAGIIIQNQTATGNVVKNNYIGVDNTGAGTTNTQIYGVYMSDDGGGNYIGGPAANEGNVISGNSAVGIYIQNSLTGTNYFRGNIIGPSSALANIAGSTQDYGVDLYASASQIIGGSSAGEGNTIAYNIAQGVDITDLTAHYNLVSRNLIYSNTGKAINLHYGATQGNDGYPVTSLTATTAQASGTAQAGDIIEVFKNSPATNCQDARAYVGTATANGAGAWTLAAVFAPGDIVTASATDAFNNTSELACATVAALPVNILSFTARQDKNSAVLLNWTSGSEAGCDFYRVERSSSHDAWISVATRKGAGNSSSETAYEAMDENPLSGNSYYRLAQVDFNADVHYYGPVAVNCGNHRFTAELYPNPFSTSAILTVKSKEAADGMILKIYDVLGRIQDQVVISGQGFASIERNNLEAGIYYYRIFSGETMKSAGKLVIE